MIILDTNVLSAPMKPQGETAVEAWLESQETEMLYLTSISAGELYYGAELLPPGKRRSTLESAIARVIASFGSVRVLSFDMQAARMFGVLAAKARAAGYAMGLADGQIAAIAASRGFTVATRNVAPFQAAGISFVNPWNYLP